MPTLRAAVIVLICAMLAAAAFGLTNRPQPETIRGGFDGGTIKEFTDFIADATEVTILFAGEPDAVTLPPLELRDASAQGALQLLTGGPWPTEDGIVVIDVREVPTGGRQQAFRVTAIQTGLDYAGFIDTQREHACCCRRGHD